VEKNEGAPEKKKSKGARKRVQKRGIVGRRRLTNKVTTKHKGARQPTIKKMRRGECRGKIGKRREKEGRLVDPKVGLSGESPGLPEKGEKFS